MDAIVSYLWLNRLLFIGNNNLNSVSDLIGNKKQGEEGIISRK